MNVITTRDENGIPTDEITLRAYNIMQRLIRANPELTQELIPGQSYKLHVVEGVWKYIEYGMAAELVSTIKKTWPLFGKQIFLLIYLFQLSIKVQNFHSYFLWFLR